jgi:hypothetical protein
VNKSSNHALSINRLTSNSSSTANFPWLSPTDNCFHYHYHSTTDSLYSSALLQLFTVPTVAASFGIWLLYFLGTDHSVQKTQPLYCCRGILPRSCLANSLGADHIENTFHSRRVFIGPIPSNGCPLLSRIVVRITEQRLFTKNLSPRVRVYRAIA